MSIAGIPEVIHDFNMYSRGHKILGITGEVTLPNFESMTETVSGAGILGEYEAPVIGRYGAFDMEIPFRCLNETYFSMIDPSSATELNLRGAEQLNNTTDSATDYVGIRIVVRGRAKNLTLGKLKQGGTMDSSITIAVTYILVEMDGQTRLELDKINGIFKVNGTDLLSRVSQLT